MVRVFNNELLTDPSLRGVAEMFKYMGASRDGEAIFLDFQKNDFNFLLIIVEDDSKNKALSISSWYRDTEWNLETVETIVPQNKCADAKCFFHEVTSYATFQNPEFMLEVQEYEQDLAVSSVSIETEDQLNEDVRTFRP